ncbi:ADP-ribosylglycohydrolase [Clostridiales bacterium PH28_bin88]|nr:ADP-ribosylglycohydrolase [Clostridiales bacterium PH28_bin88]
MSTYISARTYRRDRYLGALFGLAVGDALGFPVQFQAPGSFSPVTEMRFRDPELGIVCWSDDTSMALCLAESLLVCDGFVPRDQMERYVRWLDKGHLSSTGEAFDVGQTVLGSLQSFKRTGEPFAGPEGRWAAGNGSLMRLAPVPMFFGNDPVGAVAFSGESSRTTHQARACIDACRYFGGLLWGALRGVGKDELLAGIFEPYPGVWKNNPLCDEILEVAGGSYKIKQPPLIQGSGYVVRSLEAALWAFYSTDTFHDGALLAVNLGDDADTTAAIYGQIAGACLGFSAIPANWTSSMALWQYISELANGLCDAVVMTEKEGEGE